MNATEDWLVVGAEIAGPVRTMTAERIEWYDSGLRSAARGVLTQVGVNIHTDDAYARAQGLPGVIGDGMIMTNWCSSMLTAHFGMDYLERGELRTKFIKPVYRDVRVSTHGKIRSIDTADDGSVVIDLAIWCQDQNGLKLTDGDAKIRRPRG
ncbi:MAG: MaoC family dehydratase [Lautropia sp.]